MFIFIYKIFLSSEGWRQTCLWKKACTLVTLYLSPIKKKSHHYVRFTRVKIKLIIYKTRNSTIHSLCCWTINPPTHLSLKNINKYTLSKLLIYKVGVSGLINYKFVLYHILHLWYTFVISTSLAPHFNLDMFTTLIHNFDLLLFLPLIT